MSVAEFGSGLVGLLTLGYVRTSWTFKVAMHFAMKEARRQEARREEGGRVYPRPDPVVYHDDQDPEEVR